MSDVETIPRREEVSAEYRWNLSALFVNDEAWEQAFVALENKIPDLERFRQTLAQSAGQLRACLEYVYQLRLLGERLGYYAFLRLAEDGGDGVNQDRYARCTSLGTKLQAATSFLSPEILAMPDEVVQAYRRDPALADFDVVLKKILHFKPHVLSEKEERLLALLTEAAQTPSQAFKSLTDVDFDFGSVDTPEGSKPLSQASLSTFLIRPEHEVRKNAYDQFYRVYESHKNTLASLYAGSVHYDVYEAKVRCYPSARAKALFPDKIDETVYDNLIDVIRANLSLLHRYYALRKKALGLKELFHYDVYVPLIQEIQVHHSYEQAVGVVLSALEPLGQEYTRVLGEGLLGGWVDRYENRGKRSGAFSAGSYTGDPYILMNFKKEDIRDVFTLAHEAGHSMHSYLSVKHNPYQHYDYTIFEAEVASTVNEQLLFHYLLERAQSKSMRAFLLGKQVDDIVATVFRQTMFAEFEHRTHAMVEQGLALTVDSLRAEYRKLLEAYFGSEVSLLPVSDLEGLRIPHFYRAFYVYKYATGLSAAIALSTRILQAGTKQGEGYLAFLQSGGSRFPLESLAVAGVDMGQPQPVQDAMNRFGDLVEELASLI